MRCPKCGFISFDSLETCLKCKKNIKSTSSSLQGSVQNVAVPTFLHYSAGRSGGADEDFDTVDEAFLDDEVVDEDLEVLMTDDEEESGIEMPGNEEAPEEEISLGEEEEESEIEIDFSSFEDSTQEDEIVLDDQEENFEPEGIEAPAMELPEELADMSDLQPPGVDSDMEPALEATNPPADDDSKLDLELDGLDFDLDIEDDAGEQPGSEDEEEVLSFDDLDFADSLPKADSKKEKKSGDLGMDEDLNFELDLGGLSIHKDV